MTLEGGAMYRKIVETYNFKPVTEEQFEQLTIPLKKMGVIIMRGDDKTEQRLKIFGAQGSTLGSDIVSFRKNVSISTILEETYHIIQNRQGMNDDKEQRLRTILNEIDAKRYLLNIADTYNIPRSEIQETKKHLDYYEKALVDYYKEEGGDDDKNN